MSYTYPEALIPINRGFKKNSPNDRTVMGINNDLHGGIKVVQTHAEMLKIPNSYLLKNYSSCLVLTDDDTSVPALYYLSADPTDDAYTNDADWTLWDIAGSSEIPSVLTFQGTFDPTDYTLTDSGSYSNGDTYIVEGAENPSTITDANLLGGVTTDLYNSDWLIYNATEKLFIHVDRSTDSVVTWSTLTGIPQVIKDFVNGIYPDFEVIGDNVIIDYKVGSTTYTRLTDLLPYVIYANQLASSVSEATDTQLLNFGQMKSYFFTGEAIQDYVETYVDTLTSGYYSKDEVDAALATKMDEMTAVALKEYLEDGGYKILTEEEYEDLGTDDTTSDTKQAKIFLTAAESLTSEPLSTVAVTTTYGESYITSIQTNSTSVKLTFIFTSLNSYDGDYTVNSTKLKSITRVGDSDRFQAVVTMNLQGLSALTITGDSSLSIPIASLDNIVVKATATALVSPRTHYRDNESIPFTLITEQQITAVQIIGGGYIEALEKTAVTSVSNGDGTYTCTVTATADQPASAIVTATLTLLVYKDDEVFALYTNFSFAPIDGTLPTITLKSVTYPTTTATAIKDSEQVTIAFTTSAESVTYTLPAQLTLISISTSQAVVQRASGDEVNVNVVLTAVKASNGATTSLKVPVSIYNSSVPVLDPGLIYLRTGGESQITFTDDADFTPQLYDIVAEKGSFTQTSPDQYIVAVIDSTESIDGQTRTLQFKSPHPAEKVETFTYEYQFKGFYELSDTLTYPTLQYTVPVVITDSSKLVVTAVINSSPSLELDMVLNDTSSPAGFTVSNNTLYFNDGLVDLGYYDTTTLTLKIEETL